MSRAFLVLHPRARRHRQCSAIIHQLGERYNLTVEHSSYPGHTRELARQLLPEWDGIFFTAGGDGSFHEAVNGWADAGFPLGAHFAPLPLGAGNDFLGSIDKRLINPNTYLTAPLTDYREADLGRVTFHTGGGVESRYFCVSATAGVSALVLERRAELAHRLPGPLSYLLALFMTLSSWRNRSLRVESEEAPFHSDVFLNFNAANAKHYGGGMMSAPQADPFNGFINAVSMNFTVGQALRVLPENFRGRFDLVPDLKQLALRKPFEVFCYPPCPVQADGELLGETPMKIECFPEKLPLLLPDLNRLELAKIPRVARVTAYGT